MTKKTKTSLFGGKDQRREVEEQDYEAVDVEGVAQDAKFRRKTLTSPTSGQKTGKASKEKNSRLDRVHQGF